LAVLTLCPMSLLLAASIMRYLRMKEP
jgi:hypothetical protein